MTCCFSDAYLENLLVFLCVLAVNLLNGSHVVLEVAYGVLPCLQALTKESGSLPIPMLVVISYLFETIFLTVVGSRSGTASSALAVLKPVAAREGSVELGDGAAILSRI